MNITVFLLMQKKILSSTEVNRNTVYDHLSKEMSSMILQKIQAEHFQPDQATKLEKLQQKGKKYNWLKEFN